MVGMLGRVNVWQIAESKLVGKKFDEWIESGIRIIHCK